METARPSAETGKDAGGQEIQKVDRTDSWIQQKAERKGTKEQRPKTLQEQLPCWLQVRRRKGKSRKKKEGIRKAEAKPPLFLLG